MYFPGKTQGNTTLASMQRTFYPKHTTYFGDGRGRDQQIIVNNGGLEKLERIVGHHGFHQRRYNLNTKYSTSSRSSPKREATTFYYTSDGSGRDSYVLQDNGGLRPEYDRLNKSPQKIFTSSLRTGEKSPLKYFKDALRDKADITSYRNW